MPGSPQSGCLDLSLRSQLDLPKPRFHLGLGTITWASKDYPNHKTGGGKRGDARPKVAWKKRPWRALAGCSLVSPGCLPRCMVNRLKLSEKRMPHGRLAMLRDSCMCLTLPLPFSTRRQMPRGTPMACKMTKFGQPESGAHGPKSAH